MVHDPQLSPTHSRRVERRLLRSLVGRYVQEHAYSLLSFCALIIILQQCIIIYLAVSGKNSCVVNFDNLDVISSPPSLMSVVYPQNSYVPTQIIETNVALTLPNKVDKQHECGYPRCDLKVLNFKKLKSYARCQQCFRDLTVHRVFREIHDTDFGIEFLFYYGHHVQNWNDNDWAAFTNITSEFEGNYRLIQFGDNSTQVIQWYNLRLKEQFH